MIKIQTAKNGQPHVRIWHGTRDIAGTETYSSKENAIGGLHAVVKAVAPDVAHIVIQELQHIFKDRETVTIAEIVTAIETIHWETAVPVYGVMYQDETK